MNLFILSRNVIKNAQYHCDQHLVKMPLEIVQMLYTAIYVLLETNTKKYKRYTSKAPLNGKGIPGYRPTHINHPVNKWIRECHKNYLYAIKVGLCLCKEYHYRFNKVHSVRNHFIWLYRNIPSNISRKKLTQFILAMPDKHKINKMGTNTEYKTIESMRDYYKAKAFEYFKRPMRYTNRQPPSWLTTEFTKKNKVYIIKQ